MEPTRQRLWESPRAVPTFRTLRCLNFAPCDIPTSHPAKFRVRALRSPRCAWGLQPIGLRAPPKGPQCIRVAQSDDDEFAFSHSFSLFSIYPLLCPRISPQLHEKKRGQTRLLHLPNERRRQRVGTLCTKGSAPLYLKGSPPFVRKGQHPLSQRVTTLCAKGSAPFRRKGQHPFVRCLVRGCSLSRGEVPLASLPTPFRLVEKDTVLEDACRARRVVVALRRAGIAGQDKLNG